MGTVKNRGGWAGTWEGGRVWRAVDGTTTYYI
jgi:hypothetical protein